MYSVEKEVVEQAARQLAFLLDKRANQLTSLYNPGRGLGRDSMPRQICPLQAVWLFRPSVLLVAFVGISQSRDNNSVVLLLLLGDLLRGAEVKTLLAS